MDLFTKLTTSVYSIMIPNVLSLRSIDNSNKKKKKKNEKKLDEVSGFINEAYLADSSIIDAGTFNIERTSFASVCVILLLVCKHSKFQIESKSAEF